MKYLSQKVKNVRIGWGIGNPYDIGSKDHRPVLSLSFYNTDDNLIGMCVADCAVDELEKIIKEHKEIWDK